MVRKYKKTLGSRSYANFSEDALKQALNAIQNGMSERTAASTFKISRGTLQNKRKGLHKNKFGGQTALSMDIENQFEGALIKLSEYGFPVSAFELRQLVKNYLDKKGVEIKAFKNNYPTYEWSRLFLSRHPQLSERFAANIKIARAEITATTINNYFDRLGTELKDIPPQNIWNYDETNLTDDPGRKKVLTKRGCKYPERIINSSKSAISIMACGNAAGETLPPYVVYKSTKNIYDTWTLYGPKGARYNRTVSGWFDTACFDDWFTSLLLPILKKCEGPKAVIGDNLSSHINPEVRKLCEENDIKFICLPPNTTHLTQPLDIAFFRPMKISWRKILLSYKLKGSKTLAKSDFPNLLKTLLNNLDANRKSNVISGFRKAGIFPLNRKEVLNKIPHQTAENELNDQQEHQENSNIFNDTVLQFLEEQRFAKSDESATSSKPRRKKKLNIVPGKSVNSDINNSGKVTAKNKKTNKKSEKTKRQREESSSESERAYSLHDSSSEYNEDFEDLIENESQENITDVTESNMSQMASADTEKTSEYSAGEYVIVRYDEEYYPGKILDSDSEKGLKVSVMIRSGISNFKWPNAEDVLWYKLYDVIEKIEIPTEQNSRGICSVPEMAKYSKFI